MKSIYLSFLVLFLVGCNNDDDTVATCIEFNPAAVETVVENTTADAASYTFEVGFRVLNGCGEFSSFEQTTLGNVTIIEVIAKYEGCICTQDIPLRQTVYTFNQTIPGTYILKFKMADDNYITQTVAVE
jgi:hypothetical protein